MNYSLVSADAHIDMSWLPGDLFVKNCPAKLKEKVPQVVATKKGEMWMVGKEVLGVPAGAGFGFLPSLKHRTHRMDRMFEEGFFNGLAAKRFHPTSPDLRLEDMRKDGVDAEVIYGITGVSRKIADPEGLEATYRIYNDWLAAFCKSRPGRWFGLACVPAHDPQKAAAELYRTAKLGLSGADLDTRISIRPVYMRDGFWDPLWAASAETGLPVSFHINGAGIQVRAPFEGYNHESAYLSDAPSQVDLGYRITTQTLGQLAGSQPLVSILASGACEKFPGFRFILGESGAGWIPFVLERLDDKYVDEYYEKRFQPPLEMKPSDYWYRQGFTTFQKDNSVPYLYEQIGVANMMWGSDYPHPDGVWPDSKEAIADNLGSIPKQVVKKITCDNAVNLYKMASRK